nr:hypothetical protein CFP56_61643 [Quercus suber]
MRVFWLAGLFGLVKGWKQEFNYEQKCGLVYVKLRCVKDRALDAVAPPPVWSLFFGTEEMKWNLIFVQSRISKFIKAKSEQILCCEMIDQVGVSVVEHCQVVEAIVEHTVRTQEK